MELQVHIQGQVREKYSSAALAVIDASRVHARCDLISSNAAIEPTRVCNPEDASEFPTEAGVDVDVIAPQVQERFISAFVRAAKPKMAV